MRAIARHAAKRPGLGDQFVSEAEAAIQRAVDAPETGSPHLYGTRRMLVDRFHYDGIFITREPLILIVAVAHQRRTPGYWRSRLDEV